MLDDTQKEDFPIVPHAFQQKISHNPLNVRCSTRLIRPPERFSPSLYSILLTDVGEPKCYDKAMQLDTKIQWESAMKEEMDS